MMALSKHSKEFAAKKDVFSPKRSWGVPHRSRNSRALRAWLPFPSGEGIPGTDPFLHLQGQHCTTKVPYGSLKRTWGTKKKTLQNSFQETQQSYFE